MSDYNDVQKAVETAYPQWREQERARLGDAQRIYKEAKNATQAPEVGIGYVGGIPGRQEAKGVLLERISRLRNEAAALQALYDSLPSVLPPSADEALWQLLTRVR